MLNLFTVVVTRADNAGHETRFCMVMAESASAIVNAASERLPSGARIALILNIIVPPSCLTCVEGGEERGYARDATEADFEPATMTLEQFAASAGGLFGDSWREASDLTSFPTRTYRVH